jgi:hypothetical protein
MAAAPSSEHPSRRALRLAIGVTISFIVAQLFSWPLSFAAPVFTAMLLQAAEPLTVREGFFTLLTILFYMVIGYFIALFLMPYPAILILAVCLLIYRFFVVTLTTQGNGLTFIGTLIGLIVIPVLVNMKPEVGITAGSGLMIGFALAVLSSWIGFLLIRVPPKPIDDNHAHGAPDLAAAKATAFTMALIFTPYLIAFIVFGWTDIVTIVYATMFAMQLSSKGSAAAGLGSMSANLILGGGFMLIFYELLVMAPSLAFMIPLLFMNILFFGSRLFSHRPSAAAWTTGFTGFLILSGGALLSDDVVAPMNIIDRVIHIGFSTLYVVFAYQVADLIKALIIKLQSMDFPGKLPGFLKAR